MSMSPRCNERAASKHKGRATAKAFMSRREQRVLKVKAYLRTMDDMTLFSDDPDALTRAHERIRAWLRDERGLTLNPKRGRVLPTTQPCTALGYRISRGGLSLGRAAWRRMRARLRKAAARGAVVLGRSLRSYRAIVGFG